LRVKVGLRSNNVRTRNYLIDGGELQAKQKELIKKGLSLYPYDSDFLELKKKYIDVSFKDIKSWRNITSGQVVIVWLIIIILIGIIGGIIF